MKNSFGENSNPYMSRRTFLAGSALMGSALIGSTFLTACSSSSSSSDSTAESENVDYGTISIGINPGTGNIFGWIAKERGFDTDAHYTAEFLEFSNSTDALNALQAAKVDVAMNFGTAAPLVFVTNGADFSIIGGYVSGGMPYYGAAGFEYKDLSSFVGKTMATARMYTPDIIWRGAMVDAGYDLNTDVTILEFKKPSEVLAAVQAGEADAGAGTNSTYLSSREAGVNTICWTNDLAPDGVCCRQVVNNSWVNENEDRAVAYIESLIRAEEVLATDPDYAVEVYAKYMNLDEDTAHLQLLETHQELWADPKSNGVRKMWQTLSDIDYADTSSFDLNDHLNISIYKKALDNLVEKYPDSEYITKTLTARFEENNSEMLEEGLA